MATAAAHAIQTPSLRHLLTNSKDELRKITIEGLSTAILQQSLRDIVAIDDERPLEEDEHQNNPIIYFVNGTGKEQHEEYWSLANPLNENHYIPYKATKYRLTPEQLQALCKTPGVSLSVNQTGGVNPIKKGLMHFTNTFATQAALQLLPANLMGLNFLIDIASGVMCASLYYAEAKRSLEKSLPTGERLQEDDPRLRALKRESIQAATLMCVTNIAWKAIPVAMSIAQHVMFPLITATPYGMAAMIGMVIGSGILSGFAAVANQYFSEKHKDNLEHFSTKDYLKTFAKGMLRGISMTTLALLPGAVYVSVFKAQCLSGMSYAASLVAATANFWAAFGLCTISASLSNAVLTTSKHAAKNPLAKASFWHKQDDDASIDVGTAQRSVKQRFSALLPKRWSPANQYHSLDMMEESDPNRSVFALSDLTPTFDSDV